MRAALERLLALHESRLAPSAGESREVYLAVRRVVHHLCSRQPKYRCEHCGFAARQLHWQCPSCKHWGSIQVVQPQPLGDDGEDPLRPSAGVRPEPLNRVVDANAGMRRSRARR